MEKKQAQEYIEKVLESKFDTDAFGLFIANLLNNIDRSHERNWAGKHYIYADYREHINNYKRLGLYTDPNGEEVEILVVKTETLAKLDRARTALRNFVVKWLQDPRNKSRARDYALAAFFSGEDHGEDWRFSFIKIEHEAYRDDKGKVKSRKEITPARRYSYLVGKHENSYTARKQLLPLLETDYANPTVAEIESAFSVEKVTGEFFQQYRELYLKLAGYFEREKAVKAVIEGEELEVSRFTKKLLGQIVFLYFLQKKGWLGAGRKEKWGSGNKKFLRHLFDKAKEEGKNFYGGYLQYLFYEALAKERPDSAEPGYYPRFDCKIPFLNGGLFEADYDWRNRPVAIPDTLFHNLEKNKAGDEGTGILDVFDRYNFTVKEDEPLEKEVAVDPEMLGKVFENMLEIAERKSTGAYYTPREIVHYMCRESLIQYLDRAINGSEEICPRAALEQLIREGHLAMENDKLVLEMGKETGTYKYQLPQCLRTHAASLDQSLADIKICDPAIGSGAFPVGLLHEIVNARLLLRAYFPDKNLIKNAYDLKRHAIQTSIYGVDSDASAVDIARLRLWLSLIVDEDDYDRIDALPNLDYKIVCGNSLVGIANGTLRDRNLEIEIEKLKEQYYPETDENKKKSLRQQIDIKIRRFLKNAEEFARHKIDFDFKLFFSEVWHEKEGFDIVIGNPPYVQIQNFSGKQQQYEWEKQKYETFAKTGDIYCLFYEKGIRILREGGTLAFITSNKWMRADYGQKTRKFFTLYNPLTLIDFDSYKVFDSATVNTNILIIEKSPNRHQTKACAIDKKFTKETDIALFFENHHVELDNLSEESWTIGGKEDFYIRERINKIGTPLKKWDVHINYGIKTGLNDAFIIDGEKKNELIAKDPKSAVIIKPVLMGKNIKRYKTDFADLWLLFIPWHFPLNNDNSIIGSSKEAESQFLKNYPSLYKHLLKYKDKLENRNKAETGIRYEWYALQRCAASYYQEFEKEKLVWGNLSLNAQFSLSEAGFYVNAPSTMITPGNRYLLAVLNSSLGDFYIRSLGVTRSGGYFEYKPMFIEKLPVPKIEKESQKPFEILVDYVMLTKKSDLKLQSAFFEQLIDGLVFELYFAAEIKAAKKEIRRHLGELQPLPDKMTAAENLAAIQREFHRLYDPSHPVRNNLETLDAVEPVRIVLQALKGK